MITFLAWLTVFGLPFLGVLAICYLWRKIFPPKPVDPPQPLKKLTAETPEDQVANIIYYSYIRHAQNIFWYSKQWQWDFRKMAEYLTPRTQNRYADRAFHKVLLECREIDKARRDKTNDEIRRFPQRNRNRMFQPPWVSIAPGDVRMAVETVLSPQCVERILAMKDSLDIPPVASSGYPS
jgi:hypothetical protein